MAVLAWSWLQNRRVQGGEEGKFLKISLDDPSPFGLTDILERNHLPDSERAPCPVQYSHVINWFPT
jgi:hypothetical protein